ncbi:MAG: C40 family peptidase [Acidobacteriota bacterium]|nr:MAG: C40 family peptidase [Acidobacteriota bacterium]
MRISSAAGRSPLLFALGIWLLASCSAPDRDREITEAIETVADESTTDTRLEIFAIDATRSGSRVSLTGDVGQVEWAESVIDRLEALGLQVENQIRVLPDSSIGDQVAGIVTVSVANLRRHPAHSAELVTQALMGTRMTLLRKEGGWYLVQGPDRYLGWLEGAVMSLKSADELVSWELQPQVIFTVPAGTVWSDASDSASVVCDVVVGDTLVNAGKDGDSWRVQLPDGREGILPAAGVSPLPEWRESRQLTGESVELTARRFLGVPYLWGGTSAKGFDCSGFSKTVFALNGFQLLRDADQQARQGEPVDLDPGFGELKRGDLLFFGRKASETVPERITHVAIYLQNGDYIHATPGFVQINSLDPDSPIYSEGNANRLLRARRMIPTRTTTF